MMMLKPFKILVFLYSVPTPITSALALYKGLDESYYKGRGVRIRGRFCIFFFLQRGR